MRPTAATAWEWVGSNPVRILVATDAWHPQINGVLRTLTAVANAANSLGAEIVFLTPDGFPSIPLPTYPEVRLPLPNPRIIARRIGDVHADAVHIATEGPIGHAVRHHCIKNSLSFSTSLHTRFPEYLSARLPVPKSWAWAWLRWFHRRGSGLMVGTSAFADELRTRGFTNIKLWPPGVDSELFRPRPGKTVHWPRPIFLTVGRLAIDKNLPAFLSLDLPGTKIIVGDGPARRELTHRFPSAIFLGVKEGEELAEIFASADVFVFPSQTDLCPLVLLEALASGVPIAAFPTAAPRDMVGSAPVAVFHPDLRVACLRALALSRDACRTFVFEMTWESSAGAFLSNVSVNRKTAFRKLA